MNVNWDWGRAQFLFWEYINRNFFAGAESLYLDDTVGLARVLGKACGRIDDDQDRGEEGEEGRGQVAHHVEPPGARPHRVSS